MLWPVAGGVEGILAPAPGGAATRIDVMTDHSRVPNARSRRILGDLAETLGCSVDVFFDPSQNDDLSMTEELLNLWFSIEDPAARHRILDCARAQKAEAQPHA
ncbi:MULTISPECIES: hypothetical protein [Methylobacterium]|jgi:hypothetical protein|uniref:Uncharacterized protein n=2 Tax=Methylobacterium radiotolerans TaxID=31998 RepID=B1M4S8_METRJ|nr:MULTISPECIES: hypothetical protein [Methylobacterium]GAN51040.1 hypothetical protein ME121_5103 [Methylobacterium sp. ME121]ACB24974.1 hypothetical protein Mrad2831_2990 [Methylobacterium radiotolerans JCM 2831]MDE3750258.1 hypothetical protein [Methylobacterium radiotolerans]OXE38523.1 hypothetical protein CCS92_28995 [Methylobacterium radiotolerans]UIY39884.1 hypothetical protein LZ599_15595 [Methylobacterium radiotolerans]